MLSVPAAAMASIRAAASGSVAPSAPTIRSPSFSPASAAGLRVPSAVCTSLSPATRTPAVLI